MKTIANESRLWFDPFSNEFSPRLATCQAAASFPCRCWFKQYVLQNKCASVRIARREMTWGGHFLGDVVGRRNIYIVRVVFAADVTVAADKIKVITNAEVLLSWDVKFLLGISLDAAP